MFENHFSGSHPELYEFGLYAHPHFFLGGGAHFNIIFPSMPHMNQAIHYYYYYYYYYIGRLRGEWTVENAMKINPSKSKAVRFTRARVKDPLNYLLMGTLIPEASSCKYLRIILRSDLSWADQVNYAVEKAWKALHFTMRILKNGNSNTKCLAYMSLVRPILEYGAACTGRVK